MFRYPEFLLLVAATLVSLAASARGDPVAPQPLALADPGAVKPIEAATRQVVQGVVRAAQATAAMPPARRPTGDALTETYIRQAARAASELPEPLAASAFLYALGIALDDSDILFQIPRNRQFCLAIEPAAQRRARLTVLGQPTIRGRHDLAQHFVISCYLTAAYGRLTADAAGLAKELRDAQRGSGFSFADLAADKAGVEFASHVLSKRIGCHDLADKFLITDYVPAVDQLPEGLGWDDFVARYGDGSDPRFQQVTQEILRRIRALPPYAPDSGVPRR
jgi:hypothetical protein